MTAPVASSVLVDSTTATFASLESKLNAMPFNGRSNWSNACATNCAASPTKIACRNGVRLRRVRRPARSRKKEPSARTPGENLRAPFASVCRANAPSMSGERVIDWLTESPPKLSPAIP